MTPKYLPDISAEAAEAAVVDMPKFPFPRLPMFQKDRHITLLLDLEEPVELGRLLEIPVDHRLLSAQQLKAELVVILAQPDTLGLDHLKVDMEVAEVSVQPEVAMAEKAGFRHLLQVNKEELVLK